MTFTHAISVLALAVSLVPASQVFAQQAAPAEPAPAPAQQQTRPNILVWMLDDVGFAQLASFGGLIATPNIDRVAQMGLRYTNYHTPPICSAARASFLTGRNTHTVHMGAHAATPRDLPGYDARIPAGAGTLAENLRQAGYATFALGKWDHVPMADLTPAGPMHYWPLGQGFDRYYGFLSAETNNFAPLLIDGNTPVNPPGNKDYHLSADLADKAIAMIDGRSARSPAPPFFAYFATGVAHAPHHAPADWTLRYRGKFDQGWDEARVAILRNQKALGLVPADTQLAPRPESMPAWDSLSAEQKRLHARQMEVFAAAISHADAQFGRILDALEARGELANTIVVVVSDNGASAEGGPGGSFNELLFAVGALPDHAANMRFYDRWGGPGTHPHYAMGWAVAGNTPFRNYKQTTYEGGTRVPLVIAWPQGIAARNQVRTDFVHAADLTPTLLAAAGVQPAAMVNNAPQMPFDGQNFAYSFSLRPATPASRSQYFEMYGHRGLWADGWKIVSPSKLQTWNMIAAGSLTNPWELYDLSRDPGERVNLAASNPAKLAELTGEFEAQATRFNLNPIAEQSTYNRELAQMAMAEFARRRGTYRYPAPVRRVMRPNSPPFERGNFTMTAEVGLASGRESGPIFAHGGELGGAGLYLIDGRPSFVVRSMAGEAVTISAGESLDPGLNRIELVITPADPANPRGADHLVTFKSGGRVLESQRAAFRIPASGGELFEVGGDDGTAIGDGYAPGTPFPGDLRNVTFTFP